MYLFSLLKFWLFTISVKGCICFNQYRVWWLASVSTRAKDQWTTSVFYAPQLYRQVLLRRVLAMAILSVCLSVCPSVTTRCRTKPRWDRDFGSPPYGSLENLVSYEVIWSHWVNRYTSNEGIKEGYLLRNRYFTTIGSSSRICGRWPGKMFSGGQCVVDKLRCWE